MPYKITDIVLDLEPSKITISTNLQYYTPMPAVDVPAEPPSPQNPGGVPAYTIPAYDRIDWSKSIVASTKVDPFSSASLNAARTILVNQMEVQMKFQKRIRDKEYEIKNSGVLTTLKNNIQTKLNALP